jgi:asparaginyl-tRNA synthetase
MSIDARTVYLITAALLASLRSALSARRFIEILPAILSRRNEPGARHSIAVLGDRRIPLVENGPLAGDGTAVAVRGQRWYYLSVSHAVEKQLALAFVDRVFCLAPCVRLLMDREETSGKHLNTFFQVEVEIKNSGMTEAMDLAESVLSAATAEFIRKGPGEPLLGLPAASRNLLSLLRIPYERVTFSEAKRLVGTLPTDTQDLTGREERALSNMFDRPVWVCHYPEGVRDSLYRRNEEGLYDTYDLVLPFGHGELATGGVRADTAGEVLRQSRQLTKQPFMEAEKFSTEYADWKEQTGVQSAGFGIGLERFVQFCVGACSILEVRQAHDSGPNAELQRNELTASLCDEITEGRLQASWAANRSRLPGSLSEGAD